MVHILVIDDEHAILEVIHEFLTLLGYNVKVANCGEKGIELFGKGYNFDLVITDICMPKVDGNAVAKHIRSSEQADTPIVAITGSGDDGINKDLFNVLLQKPYELKELNAALQSVA
jgi:CheY-like chemotaxis protein